MIPENYTITSTSNIEETIEGIRARSKQFTHIDAKPTADWKYEFRRVTIGSARIGTSFGTHVSYKQGVLDDILIAGTLSGTESMRRGSIDRSLSSLASFVPLSDYEGDVNNATTWTVRLNPDTFNTYLQAYELDVDPLLWIDGNWLTPNRVSNLFGQFVAYSLNLLDELDSELSHRTVRSIEDLFYVNSTILMKAGRDQSKPSGDAIIFKRIVDYIEANIDQGLTLAVLSNATGASIRSVQYAVRREANMTVTGLITERRLQRARRLLEKSDRGVTVRSVSALVGFDNPSYFTKVYKTRFGETPGQALSKV